MSVQSLAVNSFTDKVQKINNKSLEVILKTIEGGEFPGTQLYLYFRMNKIWGESLELDDFIQDSAYIFSHKLPLSGLAENLLSRHFNEAEHILNIYKIIETAWEKIPEN